MFPFIQVFNYQIPVYGISMVVGCILAVVLSFYSGKKYGIQRCDCVNFAIYAVIGGLIGAKLLYIIVELPTLFVDPSRIVHMILGGMVFYGGVIGGIWGGYLYCRKYKINPIEFFDIAAPSLALGQAFGRVGCFMAGCCYGIEYDGFCSVVFPAGGFAPAGVPLLATQLLEAGYLLLLTVALSLILKKSTKVGRTAGWYFVLYGVWRFIIEFFRSDDRGQVFSLSTSQFISILLFIIGILFITGAIQKVLRFESIRRTSDG